MVSTGRSCNRFIMNPRPRVLFLCELERRIRSHIRCLNELADLAVLHHDVFNNPSCTKIEVAVYFAQRTGITESGAPVSPVLFNGLVRIGVESVHPVIDHHYVGGMCLGPMLYVTEENLINVGHRDQIGGHSESHEPFNLAQPFHS